MTQGEPPAAPGPIRSCCEEFARKISDHHDGRWPAGSGDCAEVEAHLAVCPRCAELLDDYRLISKAAAALRAVEVSADCAEVMRRRVRDTIRARVFRRRLKWTGAGLAVAAAASVAVAVAMLPETDPAGPIPMPAVASEDDSRDEIDGGARERIDLLRDPAVAELLRELREEALRAMDPPDVPPDARIMTIQEEIDLRREWGVRSVDGIEFRVPEGAFDGLRLPWRSRTGPLVNPGFVPVGVDGR